MYDLSQYIPIDAVIVEVGMHKGEDTIRLLNIAPLGRYYGFEPDPRNIEFLKKSEIVNSIDFIPKAVSNKIGVSEFYMSDSSESWCGSSSLLPPKEHLSEFTHITFSQSCEVETTTLDHELNHLPRIDFLWIDAQGAESMIFEGAKNVLSKTKYVYFEHYDKEMYKGSRTLQELINQLGDNWEVVEKFPNDILMRNKCLV